MSKTYLIGLGGIICYAWISYIPRYENVFLLGIYSVLFIIYGYLSLRQGGLAWGILFRLVLWLSVPWLSQDYFRFIWDGHLQNLNISPYRFTPEEFQRVFGHLFINQELLFEKMGSLSRENYSNYPPLNQFIFKINTAISGVSVFNNILIFRILFLISDITAYMNLKALNVNPNVYFLNPLLIIESTGNLHFEGFMVSLFLSALVYIKDKKYVKAGFAWGGAILTKLIPLFFLLIYIRKCNFRSQIKIWLSLGMVTGIAFLWYIDLFQSKNYQSSIGLWVSKFEFNGSIYNLIRELGYYRKGYNIITDYSFPFIIIFIILSITISISNYYKPKEKAYLILMLYFIGSTTVHPWYIITILVLSILSGRRSGILWSYLAFFSYSFYRQTEVREQNWILWLTYLPLISYFFYEELNELQKRNIGSSSNS